MVIKTMPRLGVEEGVEVRDGVEEILEVCVAVDVRIAGAEGP